MEFNYGLDNIRDEKTREYAKLTGADDAIVITDEGEVLGMATLYFNREFKEKESCYIGMFNAKDENLAESLLDKCMEALLVRNVRCIIAPIDGSTWFRYRFMNYDSGEAEFSLEPRNPLWYNDVFLRREFEELNKYRTDIFSIENAIETSREIPGLVIRNINLSNISEELDIIYDISIKSFKDNFLYSDIERDAFKKLYMDITHKVNEDLVIIAEYDNKPVGFFFALDGGDNRIILKTTAVLEEYRSMGIGTKLMNHVIIKAKDAGYKRAISALMSCENYSVKMTSKYGSTLMREYTIYYKEF